MYLEASHSLSSSSSAAATTTSNMGNKFDAVYYQVYKQIDFIKKFKINSDMNNKEKEEQLIECKKAYEALNESYAKIKVKFHDFENSSDLYKSLIEKFS